MRLMTGTGTAAVLLFVGMIIPAQAQHEGPADKQGGKRDQKQGKPAKPKSTHVKRAPSPPQHAPQAQQQRQEERQRIQPQQRAQQYRQVPEHPQRGEQQARAWQQQQGWRKQGGWHAQTSWQQLRARHWASDHRTWSQRGGYGGYYIPQDRFAVSFGRSHAFRLRSRPVMYEGYPRFEYDGFSFLLVDPYPEYWADNWYAADDVYIDYDNGYYLIDPRYPQVRLAITVTL